MKLFKQLEFYANIVLLSSLAIWCIYKQEFDVTVSSYMIAGMFQVAGMLIHAWNNWFTAKWSSRWFYHWIVFVLLLLFFPGFSFYFLGFTAPLFALYYTILCGRELKTLHLKELVHLK
jgi:hypothetical protein